MNKKEYMKEYRIKRYDRGLCVFCKNDRLTDSVFCQLHLDNDTNKRAKKKESDCLSGLCSHCHKIEIVQGKKYCIQCLNASKQDSRNRRNSKLIQGLCSQHGCENIVAIGKKKCEFHLAKDVSNGKIKRLDHQERGLCKECSRDKLSTHSLCEVCFYKSLAARNLGTVKNWEQLKSLFEATLYCPYTGRQLILGNVSLDHIIPISRGGKNDISNLQWVYFENCGGLDLNRIKGAMLESEFKSAIKEIYEHLHQSH